MKDVDHYLKIIEHDPLAGRKSVDCYSTNFVILLQSSLDLIRNRLKLRLGCGRADYKKISKGGNFPQVDDDNVFGLFIRRELCAKNG